MSVAPRAWLIGLALSIVSCATLGRKEETPGATRCDAGTYPRGQYIVGVGRCTKSELKSKASPCDPLAKARTDVVHQIHVSILEQFDSQKTLLSQKKGKDAANELNQFLRSQSRAQSFVPAASIATRGPFSDVGGSCALAILDQKESFSQLSSLQAKLERDLKNLLDVEYEEAYRAGDLLTTYNIMLKPVPAAEPTDPEAETSKSVPGILRSLDTICLIMDAIDPSGTFSCPKKIDLMAPVYSDVARRQARLRPDVNKAVSCVRQLRQTMTGKDLGERVDPSELLIQYQGTARVVIHTSDPNTAAVFHALLMARPRAVVTSCDVGTVFYPKDALKDVFEEVQLLGDTQVRWLRVEGKFPTEPRLEIWLVEESDPSFLSAYPRAVSDCKRVFGRVERDDDGCRDIKRSAEAYLKFLSGIGEKVPRTRLKSEIVLRLEKYLDLGIESFLYEDSVMAGLSESFQVLDPDAYKTWNRKRGFEDFTKGLDLLHSCRWNDALSSFEFAGQRSPDFYPFVLFQARALAGGNRNTEAIEKYEQILRLRTDDSIVLAETGWVMYASGQLSGARDAFQRSWQSEPRFQSSLGLALVSGDVEEGLGWYYKARAAWFQVEDKPPAWPTESEPLIGQSYLGRAAARVGIGGDARTILSKLLRDMPSDSCHEEHRKDASAVLKEVPSPIRIEFRNPKDGNFVPSDRVEVSIEAFSNASSLLRTITMYNVASGSTCQFPFRPNYVLNSSCTVPLLPGPNVLKVEAHDDNGNSLSQTLVVKREL